MTRRRGDEGFTLIELMVVVLIIAILIGIAIPTFLGLRTRAEDRAAQATLRDGLTAAKAFFTDDDSYAGFAAPGVAAGIEASTQWDELGGPATEAVVVIRQDDPNQVTLVTMSTSGQVFCIADDALLGTVRATDDAADFGTCGTGVPASSSW